MPDDTHRDPSAPDLATPRRPGPFMAGGANGDDEPPVNTVRLDRGPVPATTDQALWTAIRYATDQLSYATYEDFLEKIMCLDDPPGSKQNAKDVDPKEASARKLKLDLRSRRALPFPDVEPYRLLKVATEVFLMVHCGVCNPAQAQESESKQCFPTTLDDVRLDEERKRYHKPNKLFGEIQQAWEAYLVRVGVPREPGEPTISTIPYLAIIRRKLGDVPIRYGSPHGSTDGQYRDEEWLELCYGILREKFLNPCFLELIWSYWHEEGMLVQTLNAISQRFQNIRGGRGNPLGQLEISPLRPLSNLLWGSIQDEQHRLTVRRRVYEYDHHYGLALYGKAVPDLSAADSRSKFLEAFHNLLYLCAIFFKEDDDKTVAADGFPVLNALKEVHLLLSEGQHNQYGDLPWTARIEMLIQQWLLARPEFREFLPTRIMVAYPEPWMDRVDAMKKLQGWSDTSVLHFRNLGVFGEQILLSIRFGAWSTVNDPAQGANWARYWRPEIQGYIHAYRATTGVDLTDTSETMVHLRYVMPSVHLRNRLAAQPALGPGAPASLPAAGGAGRPLPVPAREFQW